MDLDRFRALAEAFGGDVARWPDAERAEAEAIAASDPVAPAILADAAALDDALAAWTVAPPDDLTLARLRRDAKRALDRAPYPRRIAFAQAAAVLLCLVAGALAGATPDAFETAEDEDLISVALSAEEWG